MPVTHGPGTYIHLPGLRLREARESGDAAIAGGRARADPGHLSALGPRLPVTESSRPQWMGDELVLKLPAAYPCIFFYQGDS